jgi:hypothetical protein
MIVSKSRVKRKRARYPVRKLLKRIMLLSYDFFILKLPWPPRTGVTHDYLNGKTGGFE